MTLEERVRAHARAHFYRGDELADELPAHLVWQAPLVAGSDDLARRMEHAGRLWLSNHDLRFASQLILSHRDQALSFIFQRALAPNQDARVFGPIAKQLLIAGPTLFATGVRWLESDDVLAL